MNVLGRQFTPDVPATVQPYRSGGIGHVPGDESRSVVGMVPTEQLARFREHGGDWRGESSDRRVDEIRRDIRSGVGIKEPLMLLHDQDQQWAYLGEGNHRLRAAELEGQSHVPVRVVGRGGSTVARRRQEGVGAPAPLPEGTFKDDDGHNYEPPTWHPSHLFGRR